MNKSYDLIGLGYCGLDYLCLAPRIPVDDKVEALATLTQGGGPAATATYAAARLGSKTAFIGAVGDDNRGRTTIDGLRDGGVDIAAMVTRSGMESPAAFCWIEEPTGHRSIVWTRGGVQPLSPEEIDVEMIKNARMLHLDGHQTSAALHAAGIARTNGVTVAIDAGTMVPGIEKLLALADIVIASEKFAERFTGEADPEIAAKKLFGGNCRFAAVTAGGRGSIGFDGRNIFKQPSFKVKVVDTTGAGDVFHGAFAYRYLNGGDWAACLCFAAAVAALKCTKFGGRTGIPSLFETENFMKNKGY
jgi:ribokinase